MGQQQLLLVILVTIIVGIATVVAINTFSSSADSANVDAARQDAATIAAAAQGYYLKPTMLGGGGNSFTGLTFNAIAFGADSVSSDGLTALNQNGKYVLDPSAGTSMEITVHPASRITGTPNLTSTATEGQATIDGTITEGGLTWDSGDQ